MAALPTCPAHLPGVLPCPPACVPPRHLPQLAAIKGLIGEVRLGLRQINTEVVQVRSRSRGRLAGGSGQAAGWLCQGGSDAGGEC